jgi:hypothetical protein
MAIKLSNVWENLDSLIMWMVDDAQKARYKKIYDTKTGKLLISEIDFLKTVCQDFVDVVTFRFLFDYPTNVKKGILEAIRSDMDLVVNKLMVDLYGQLNVHDVKFQGADEVEDIERYRELDGRISANSSAQEDMRWIRDWVFASMDETDKPDINALEAIYRKWLRVTGYSNDYAMVSPGEMLLELEQANEPIVSLQDQVERAVNKSQEKYKWLEEQIPQLNGYTDAEALWLMQLKGEMSQANEAERRELDRIWGAFLEDTDYVNTAQNLSIDELIAVLSTNEKQ